MAFSNQPVDSNGIPVGNVYVPGNGFIAIAGSTNTNTDGQSNQSTPISLDISQIGDQTVTMGGNDGVTAPTMLQILTGFYNGATIDQARGNMDTITIINASNVTTTQTSGLQTNYNARGAIIVLDMIDASASPSITLSVLGVEPVTGTTWTILTGVAVTANGASVYRIYPGLIPISNATVNDILPRSWQIQVVANNANSATYMVCAIIMN